jgi:O-antigen ligase
MDARPDTLDRWIAVCLAVFAVFSIFSISVAQIAASLGGGAWLYGLYREKSWKEREWPLAWPFLFFVLACFVAVATAVDVGRSFKPLKKLLEILIVFWVAQCAGKCDLTALFPQMAALRRLGTGRELLLNLLMISACLAAVYGVYQALTLGVSKHSRVAGTMSIYMTFAGLLMLVGMMALARLLFARAMQRGALAVLGLLAVCLLLTLTRQAWLGFVAGTLLLLSARDKRFLAAIPVIAAVVWLAAPEAVAERLRSFTDLKDSTFAIRLELWRGGWEVFKDHPLTGCGFKCVDTVYPQYAGYPALARFKGLHSNFVQLAVDTGILGLTAWIGIWVAFFRRLRQLRPAHPDCWIEMGSVAAVTAFLVAGCFEVNFYDSEVIMLLYFLMGLPFAKAATSRFAESSH